MPSRHRKRWIACLLAAGLAVAGAVAIVGVRVFEVVHRTLEIFYGDRGDPIPAPDLAAALLLTASALLVVAAAALAVAGRRAALALERASLIELR